jgi:hypothetical protein
MHLMLELATEYALGLALGRPANLPEFVIRRCVQIYRVAVQLGYREGLGLHPLGSSNLAFARVPANEMFDPPTDWTPEADEPGEFDTSDG